MTICKPRTNTAQQSSPDETNAEPPVLSYQAEPATVPVAPVISHTTIPIAAPTAASGGYGASSGGGYGSGSPAAGGYSSSFNSQPPRQYGNEENMQKQVRAAGHATPRTARKHCMHVSCRAMWNLFM